jgi:hypothetical protein
MNSILDKYCPTVKETLGVGVEHLLVIILDKTKFNKFESLQEIKEKIVELLGELKLTTKNVIIVL